VSKEKAEHLSKEVDIPHFEVSAKTGQGVKELFDAVTLKLMGKTEMPEELEKKFILGEKNP